MRPSDITDGKAIKRAITTTNKTRFNEAVGYYRRKDALAAAQSYVDKTYASMRPSDITDGKT